MNRYKSIYWNMMLARKGLISLLLLVGIVGFAATAEKTYSEPEFSETRDNVGNLPLKAGSHGIGEDYDPVSPGDPSPEDQIPEHLVSVCCQPENISRFEPSTSFKMPENSTRFIYALPEKGWRVSAWVVNGERLSEASPRLEVTMGNKPIDIVAEFSYNPLSPGDPDSNYFDSFTGRMIIDDFLPGELNEAIIALKDRVEGNPQISEVMIKGILSSEDWNYLGMLNNCQILDLSRIGGNGDIPRYAFSSMRMEDLILPSVVETIGEYAFYNARINSITVYSVVPPACTSTTFLSMTNKGNCVVYVPQESVELYREADYWKEFSILPIIDNSYSLSVSLPEDGGGWSL